MNPNKKMKKSQMLKTKKKESLRIDPIETPLSSYILQKINKTLDCYFLLQNT